MIVALLLALLPPPEKIEYDFRAPHLYIQGEPYLVTVEAVAPQEGTVTLPIWALTPAAFEVDGAPLGVRDSTQTVPLEPGQRVETTIDLGPVIRSSPVFEARDFRLGFALGPKLPPHAIYFLRAAERGIDFMTLPEPQLGDYDVVLQTLHGPIWLELWPAVASRHVRNFLDLAYTGFYDDNHFHRVIPGFMIQGGGAKPGRAAPRRVKNEFNDRRHVAGVLSMARLGVDTKSEQGKTISQFDSATCEFFIMHKISPNLDGTYTAFGRVVVGMSVVEKVVNSVKDRFLARDPRTHKPLTRQTIYKAVVVKAPPRRPGAEDSER